MEEIEVMVNNEMTTHFVCQEIHFISYDEYIKDECLTCKSYKDNNIEKDI